VKTSGCAVDIQNQGDRNTIHACHLRNASTDSIQVLTGALDTVIHGNVIDSPGGVGVDVQSGAQDASIISNVFRDMTTGVDVISGATGTQIRKNDFFNVTTEVADAAAGTISDGNSPYDERKLVRDTAGNVPIAGSGLDAISTGITFPGLGGNGFREFLVSSDQQFLLVPNSAATYEVAVEMKMGPLDTDSDPTVANGLLRVELAGGEFEAQVTFTEIKVTPDAGDVVGIYAEENPVGNGDCTARRNTTYPVRVIIVKVRE
jgi:hypothetical protein